MAKYQAKFRRTTETVYVYTFDTDECDPLAVEEEAIERFDATTMQPTETYITESALDYVKEE